MVQEWGSCRGSRETSRGYTCGLWLLLHSLAARSTPPETVGAFWMAAVRCGLVAQCFSHPGACALACAAVLLPVTSCTAEGRHVMRRAVWLHVIACHCRQTACQAAVPLLLLPACLDMPAPPALAACHSSSSRPCRDPPPQRQHWGVHWRDMHLPCRHCAEHVFRTMHITHSALAAGPPGCEAHSLQTGRSTPL